MKIQTQSNGLIRLDFGEWGHIDLPPSEVQKIISCAVRHHDLRLAIQSARGQLTRKATEQPEAVSL